MTLVFCQDNRDRNDLLQIERPLALSTHVTDNDYYTLITQYSPLYHLTFPAEFGIPPLHLIENTSISHYLYRIPYLRPSESDMTLLSCLKREVETVVEKTELDIPCPCQPSYYIDDTNRYIVLISDTIIIIMNTIDQSVFSYGKNGMFYKSKTHFQLRINIKDLSLRCTITNSTLHSFFTQRMKQHEMTITLEPHRMIEQYRYTNEETNVKLHSYTMSSPEKEVRVVNKNGLIMQQTFHRATKVEHLISQCMMNDPSSGLRFRGKYEEEKRDGQLTKKILTKDDTIVYQKDENGVTIDTIQKKRNKNEITIGWKVAKSASGELRIVKLGIPVDAEMVMAIDNEFFSTRGKERCNKCIVMDIQKCVRDEETTVVPDEMTAYSFLYRGVAIFQYCVGSMIEPDLFNPDENESCANGIHFYQNRNDVFDIYVDRLE